MFKQITRRAVSLVLTLATVLTVAIATPLTAKAETRYVELYPFSGDYYYEENDSAYLERLEKTKEWLAAIPTDARSLDWYTKYVDMYAYNTTDEIETLAKKITVGANNDFDKTLAIHDWVSANIHYDYDVYNHEPEAIARSDEAYEKYGGGALFTLNYKLAVCATYTILTHALLSSVGIPSVDITYTDHVANLVWVDGRWMKVDTTWDSDSEPISVAPEFRYVKRNWFDCPIENWGSIDFDAPVAPVPDWFTTDMKTGVIVSDDDLPLSLMNQGNAGYTSSDFVVAYENGDVRYFDVKRRYISDTESITNYTAKSL
jgi:hypothetical protein